MPGSEFRGRAAAVGRGETDEKSLLSSAIGQRRRAGVALVEGGGDATGIRPRPARRKPC